MAHVYMMAAVQPFLSGSISKTINMPNSATVQEIEKVYMESWKLALKSIAIYRDGSKVVQPLAVFKEKKEEKKVERKKLPDERKAIAHRFRVGNQEGYLHVGLFDDGSPGEIFITMSKQGSTLAGFMDSFALAISIGLQYGVPLKVWISKYINTKFEPMGWTDNPDIPVAKSVMDYLARWLAMKFLSDEDLKDLGRLKDKSLILTDGKANVINGNGHDQPEEIETTKADVAKLSLFVGKDKFDKSDLQGDAPACHECGSMMIRSGSCYVCTGCGATSGCS